MRTLSFLGTTHAMPLTANTTCLYLDDGKTNLLIDVSGGYDIRRQMHAFAIDPSAIQNIFISHCDSDHILGIVPLVRMFHRVGGGGKRTIFCNKETRLAMESLFSHVAKSYYEAVKPTLTFVELGDRTPHALGSWDVIFFDVHSKKTPQAGFFIRFPDQKTLAFLGDEPLRDAYQDIVEKPTVLIHEAFCVEADKEKYKPHEKHHSTVKEAAENAARLGAETFVLFHLEDETLPTRKERYGNEARKYFSGNVVVPVDGDRFQF